MFFTKYKVLTQESLNVNVVAVTLARWIYARSRKIVAYTKEFSRVKVRLGQLSEHNALECFLTRHCLAKKLYLENEVLKMLTFV